MKVRIGSNLAVVISQFAGPPMVNSLYSTCRPVIVGSPEYRQVLLQRESHILAVWHQGIISMMWYFRARGVCVMISASKDGEIVARATKGIGFRVVRGSSSRFGKEAYARMLQELRSGAAKIGGFVADGPRGPAHELKIGAVLAARETGLALYGGVCAANPSIHAKSWDRTEIPKPFATLYYTFTGPLLVPAAATGERCERIRQELQEQMRRNDARLHALGPSR